MVHINLVTTSLTSYILLVEVNAAEEATEVMSLELHSLKVPSTSFASSKVNMEKKNWYSNDPFLKSHNGGIYSYTENEPESNLSTHQGLTERITPLSGKSVNDERKPLTRAQAKQRSIQHFSNSLTRNAPRQKLNSTEK